MRKLLWFSIGFTLACVLCAYVYSIWLLVGIPLGVICFVVLVFLHNRSRFLPIIAAVCLGISLGLTWFGLYRYFYLMPAIDADGSEQFLNAQVIDYSEPTRYGVSVKARLTIDGKTFRSVLYLKGDHDLKPGDSVQCRFRLRMTHEGLEGDTYHRGSRIFLLAYAQDEEICTISDQVPVRYLPAFIRKGITEKIDQLFADDTAPFAKALFLGDRSDIDYETNTAFKVSGISHIIAVSGLHISILFSVIFTIAGRKPLLTAILGIPTLILFAAVTGFTPSVTRACVMQILIILSELVLREYDPPTSLGTAVLVMLLCNPIAVTSVSLQLSVGCMIGIFLFSDRLHRWVCSWKCWSDWRGKNLRVRFRNWISSSISITLAAMIVTMPLVAYYFGCISLIGVITNLLTLWAVSWIFCGIIFVCLLGLVWIQGGLLIASTVSWIVRYVLGVVKLLSSIPLAAIYLKSTFVAAWLIICYVLVFGFLLWKNRKPFVLVATLISSLTIALMLSWIMPLTAQSRVTILDVGQGQSIILQSKGRTFLVDCGGDDPQKAADEASETLLSMGIYRLDGIILTHYDQDHSGGIPYLLSRIKADSVYIPVFTEEESVQQSILSAAENSVILVQQDTHFDWSDCSLEIFAPVYQSGDNESGLSVLFCGENCDILITGDMGINAENKLLLEKSIPQLTALVAGHHGSPYSTGDGLLSMTKPQYVFISVGSDNSFGHPSEAVLERIEQHDCLLFRTDLDGTIVFRR